MIEAWSGCFCSNPHEVDGFDEELVGNEKFLRRLINILRHQRGARAPAPAPLDRRIDWLVKLLELDDIERDILAILVRCALHQEWQNLLTALPGRGNNPGPNRIAMLTGQSTSRIEQRLRPGSRLFATGLIRNDGDGEYRAEDFLERIGLTQTAPSRLGEVLMPRSRKASLEWSDFDHVGELRDIAFRLLAGGGGVPILLYGPPGTGKTEFAHLLAERAGMRAVLAGQEDQSGGEPTRGERLGHLVILRALTRNDPTRIVVMDEADDILLLGGERGREGRSKLWLNNLIEGAARPTIWIVNEPGMLEESIVRRMALAIEFPTPPLHVRRRIVARQARKARLRLSDSEAARLAALPAAPAVLGSAIRSARAVGGGAAEAVAIGAGLVTAITGRPPEPFALPAAYDPALAFADCDLEGLAGRLQATPDRGWSLLLSGPSGTGKSAYARHLADRLGVALIERRGSDLLGMFVGETEAQIARAFAEAAQGGALLLIDEADDFLSDRREATRSWERSMVNEMLRQMETLRAPFVATTNLADRLDPATQRRFTMHARFRALDPGRAASLYAASFGHALPNGVALEGQTPGDFAVVAKRAKLLGEGNPLRLVHWLRAEAAARGEGRAVMGFAA